MHKMGWFGLVRGDPRSSAKSPFDKIHMICYLSLIETIQNRFPDRASYLLKFANFDLPHLNLAPPMGVTPFEFQKRLLVSENQSPWAITWRCLCHRTFSCFSRRSTCDRQTDRHKTMAYTAQSIARAVKILHYVRGDMFVLEWSVRT